MTLVGQGILKCNQLVLQLLGCEHGRRNAAQTACLKDSDSQPMILRASHGRLNQPNAMFVKKRCVHDFIIHWPVAHTVRRMR